MRTRIPSGPVFDTAAWRGRVRACGSRRGERRVGGHGSRAAGAARESTTNASRSRPDDGRVGMLPGDAAPWRAADPRRRVPRVRGPRRGRTVRRATRRARPSWSGIDEVRARGLAAWRGRCRAPRAAGYVAARRGVDGGVEVRRSEGCGRADRCHTGPRTGGRGVCGPERPCLDDGGSAASRRGGLGSDQRLPAADETAGYGAAAP